MIWESNTLHTLIYRSSISRPVPIFQSGNEWNLCNGFLLFTGRKSPVIMMPSQPPIAGMDVTYVLSLDI